MAELFEQVVAVLEGRSSTRSLAGQFRVDSEEAAGNAAALGVPVVITELARRTSDPSQSIALLKVLRNINPAGLQNLGVTVESRLYEPVGSELIELLLGERRMQVAAIISGEARVSERSASSLLPPTAWAVMAAIADRHGNRIDRQSLLAILNRECEALVRSGWGPWLDATSNQPPDQADDGPRTGGNASADDDVFDRAWVALTADTAVDPALAVDAVAAPGSATAVAEVAAYHAQRLLTESSPAEMASSRSRYPSHVASPSSSTSSSSSSSSSFSAGRSRSSSRPSESADGSVRSARSRRAGPNPNRRVVQTVVGAALFLGIVAAGVYWLFVRNETDLGVATAGVEAAAESQKQVSEGADVVFPDMDILPVDVTLTDQTGESSALGSAELRFDKQAGKICYSVDAGQSSETHQGRIRAGQAGVAGDVLVTFGPFTSPAIGCVETAPSEMQVILGDPAGHYVELANSTTGLVLRAQLSENTADHGTG